MLSIVSCIALATVTSANPLSFIAIGDWGGQEEAPYTTPSQLVTAKAMANAGDQAEFILAIGDNFYVEGVESVDSVRFNATFEKVYWQQSLQKPWHVVAGNHDHRGNVEAQIAYSRVNQRWQFPNYYYTFNQTFASQSSGKNLTAQFVMIDTVLLSGSWDFFEPQPLHDIDESAADDQWQWIENTLSQSTADLLIVAGHYPVYSVAEHGPTQDLIDRLLPMMQKAGVALYLCGHEHNAQFLLNGLHDGGPDYVTADAVESSDTVGHHHHHHHHHHHNPGDADGMFALIQAFDENSVTVNYIDDEGHVAFKHTTANPRKQQ